MAGREKDSLIPTLVLPGPGYYDGEYTAVKPKPPVYSMRGKYKMVTDDNKPGPGAHCPEKYWEKRSTPSISFGIIHSQFCGKQGQYLLPERYTRCLLEFRPDKGYP
ncbi:hypothetical protein ACLKA7_003945 [Drosophila subpalustris]